MYKKLLSLLMAFTMGFTIIFPQTAFAHDSNVQKHNFNFIINDGKNVEYTYNENGKNYKVVEELSENSTKIDTKIYEKKYNNQYVLKEKYNTTVASKNDNNLIIKKTQDGNETIQILHLRKDSKNLNARCTIMNKLYASNWEFVDEHTGSTFFKSFTAGVVTSIILTVITGGLGLNLVASAAVSTLAGMIVSDKIPYLYYNRKVEYWREDGYVTRVRITTDFYYDSDLNHFIERDQAVEFGKFPW